MQNLHTFLGTGRTVRLLRSLRGMDDDRVRRRVLVVEDEPVIDQAVADRLAAEGFDVRQAYDGPAAVEAAAEWQPTWWSST